MPFRLVLRSWPLVDYRDVTDNLDIELIQQVGEALAGNSTLKHLCFAKRQISDRQLEGLCAPLAQSQVRKFEIIDDWEQRGEKDRERRDRGGLRG